MPEPIIDFYTICPTCHGLGGPVGVALEASVLGVEADGEITNRVTVRMFSEGERPPCETCDGRGLVYERSL